MEKKVVVICLSLFLAIFNSYAQDKAVNQDVSKTDVQDEAIDVDGMVREAKEVANDIKDNVVDMKDKALDKIKDITKDSKDVTSDVVNKAKEIGESIKEKTKDIVKDNSQKINDVSNEVKEVVKSRLYGDEENSQITDSDDSNVKGKILNGSKVNNTPSLYDNALNWEDDDIRVKKEKFIADYRQARSDSDLVEILRSKSLDARVDSRGIIINLENALFDFNEVSLSSKALPHIKEISEFLQLVPQKHIIVEGHTDSVGTVLYNHKLSEGRAKNVVDELVKNGVSRSRLEYKGYGESDPIATNRTQEGRDRNRRVELVVK